ncbi:hypothetical protein Btru_065678 [Bulinus truncatus]|nr:hypothetical protein Btru_065678 [Bulinus truncatus]
MEGSASGCCYYGHSSVVHGYFSIPDLPTPDSLYEEDSSSLLSSHESSPGSSHDGELVAYPGHAMHLPFVTPPPHLLAGSSSSYDVTSLCFAGLVDQPRSLGEVVSRQYQTCRSAAPLTHISSLETAMACGAYPPSAYPQQLTYVQTSAVVTRGHYVPKDVLCSSAFLRTLPSEPTRNRCFGGTVFDDDALGPRVMGSVPHVRETVSRGSSNAAAHMVGLPVLYQSGRRNAVEHHGSDADSDVIVIDSLDNSQESITHLPGSNVNVYLHSSVNSRKPAVSLTTCSSRVYTEEHLRETGPLSRDRYKMNCKERGKQRVLDRKRRANEKVESCFNFNPAYIEERQKYSSSSLGFSSESHRTVVVDGSKPTLACCEGSDREVIDGLLSLTPTSPSCLSCNDSVVELSPDLSFLVTGEGSVMAALKSSKKEDTSLSVAVNYVVDENFEQRQRCIIQCQSVGSSYSIMVVQITTAISVQVTPYSAHGKKWLYVL